MYFLRKVISKAEMLLWALYSLSSWSDESHWPLGQIAIIMNNKMAILRNTISLIMCSFQQVLQVSEDLQSFCFSPHFFSPLFFSHFPIYHLWIAENPTSQSALETLPNLSFHFSLFAIPILSWIDLIYILPARSSKCFLRVYSIYFGKTKVI